MSKESRVLEKRLEMKTLAGLYMSARTAQVVPMIFVCRLDLVQKTQVNTRNCRPNKSVFHQRINALIRTIIGK